MRWLRKLALVGLVTLWVPATSHCLLAALSGLESLTCCGAEQTEASPSHNDPCDSDTCAELESGLYKTEPGQILVPQPNFDLVLFEHHWEVVRFSPAAHSGGGFTGPPDVTSALHFRIRNALPARAPTARA
jgi:hypothetical protein